MVDAIDLASKLAHFREHGFVRSSAAPSGNCTETMT